MYFLVADFWEVYAYVIWSEAPLTFSWVFVKFLSTATIISSCRSTSSERSFAIWFNKFVLIYIESRSSYLSLMIWFVISRWSYCTDCSSYAWGMLPEEWSELVDNLFDSYWVDGEAFDALFCRLLTFSFLITTPLIRSFTSWEQSCWISLFSLSYRVNSAWYLSLSLRVFVR